MTLLVIYQPVSTSMDRNNATVDISIINSLDHQGRLAQRRSYFSYQPLYSQNDSITASQWMQNSPMITKGIVCIDIRAKRELEL